MKICWDNLEKVIFTKKGNFRDKNKGITYIYRDKCNQCNEPFLSAAGREKFCDINCSTLFSANKRKGKNLSKEIKEKISKANTGKIRTLQHRKNISNGMKKENHRSWKGGLKEKGICSFDTYKDKLFYENIRNNENILEVKCAYCGKWYIPKRYEVDNRIKSFNGKNEGERRLYCSIECKKECPTYRRRLYPRGFKPATSREVQPELRQMVFERDNYTCVKCGVQKSLHCHHIEGIRWEPLESADMDKCITLCKTCHKQVHKIEGCGTFDMRCK